MLADGQELDMGKAEIAHIGRQSFSEFAISQPFVAALATP